MDDMVKLAMAKWPKVPHCYGWLALDARGVWRMRDERAQQLKLPGDKITQAALLGFINRNYASDERGCWFFQNGPQRVYVELEATPFIARTDPREGLLLHTGDVIGQIGHAWLTEAGELIVHSGERVAQLDDRDLAQLMAALALDGKPAADEALMAWLTGAPGELSLTVGGQQVTVERIERAELASRFHFERHPRP
jgi:hypothetical protein